MAVILAAGRGSRMGGDVPKVLISAAGRPLLEWVVDLSERAGCQSTVAIVGFGAEEVRRRFAQRGLGWAHQAEQLGTGHALLQAEEAVPSPSLLLVLSGDAPLLRESTARRLLAAAEAGWGALVTATLDNPGSLGRVVTDSEGRYVRCVEAADATAEELSIRRVNAGVYALPAPDVFDFLRRLQPDNAQAEIYLPQALELAVEAGRDVHCVEVSDPSEAWGVNDSADLARVSGELNRRHETDRGSGHE